ADFQFIGSRVGQFKIETKDIQITESRTQITTDFDYNIKEVKKLEDNYFGCIEFMTIIKAKVKNTFLFKINLSMEGAFTGNSSKLTLEKFQEMLELNGLVTLSQLSRSYILSVTALSGINPPVKLPMINVVSLRQHKKTELEKTKHVNS
ncbi:MAG: preprotein translocase subunit SecB, partial [Bacillota bacterium]|nr:preprotein translocase subunit SecB [Bacillota bacterium]